MTISSISNLSVQGTLTSVLQAEQSSLTTLTTQLSTQQQYTDLTDYTPSQARNLISLQSTATQRQAYLSVIGTVSTNLSVYDTTLTDLESVAAQAQTIVNNNQSFNADSASNVSIESGNYLQSVTADLNQEINGRYIYSGTRYTTAPVQDLATLSTSSLTPTIQTDGSTLPTYDSESSLVGAVSGQTINITGTPIAGQEMTITINNSAYNYTVQAGDTATDVAANFAAEISGGGVPTTNSGGVLTVDPSGTINSTNVTTTDAASYTTDQASIDTGFTVNYGLSSNNPAFQQLIAGLRYLQAAGQSTDSATYTSNMQQASSLITSAISSLQAVHTAVANNINVMTSETASQNAAITSLTNQVADIQQVDVTQVSTEITALQTILQASYLVTGDIEKLSIVSYL